MERARSVALAPALILGVAFVTAFARTLIGTWSATSDDAVIALRTLDVGGSHTPLVGPYSRYGWSHPGPALFYALAPMLRVFGDHDIGLLAGAIFINAVALACLFVVTWRRRDAAAFVIAVLVVAVFLRATGGQSLFDPWNPYVIVLPLFAAAVCAWAAIGGGRGSLATAVVLASFVAQTHIGAVPAAVVLVGFAFVWVAVDTARARGDDRRRGVRTIEIAAGAGLVVWLPPIVQAATSSGGNLRAIWHFWSAPHAVTGWAEGARLVAAQFAIPAPWMGAHESILLGGALAPRANRFPVALILLVVVACFAFRRRDRDAIALCSLAAAVAFTTWIAASRLVGIPYPYLLRWAWVAGACTWFAVLWTGWRLIPATAESARRVTLLVGSSGACVLAALLVVSAARTPYPVSVDSRALSHVRTTVLALMHHARGPILIESGPSVRSTGIAAGLLLDATRAAIPARLPAPVANQVGRFRTLTGRPGTVVFVASDVEVGSKLHNPSYRPIATYDSLDSSDRLALQRLLHFVDNRVERLAELKRDHPTDYDRLLQLEAEGARVVVFLRTG